MLPLAAEPPPPLQVEGPYLAAAQGALLGELRMEPLVLGLSDAYELCRCRAGWLACRPAPCSFGRHASLPGPLNACPWPCPRQRCKFEWQRPRCQTRTEM